MADTRCHAVATADTFIAANPAAIDHGNVPDEHS